MRCSVPRIAHVRTTPSNVPAGTSGPTIRGRAPRPRARRPRGPGPGCPRARGRRRRGRRASRPRVAGRGGGGGGSRRPSGRALLPLITIARQAAGDDLGDAVARHRDAVQAVGRLHRALLVRDDDELRAVGEAAQEGEEAVDVEVVERGLDLVEDVERARPGEEDGEQERERGQRLLAARQQRQALGRLAGGRDLDLDAGVVVLLLLLGLGGGLGILVRRGLVVGLAPPSTGRGPASSRTSRSRPRPPGKSCSATSSKLRAAASKVSSKASRMRRSVSRIRPSSSRIAVSRSSRWRLELLDVRDRLVVLALGERVDGAELLAAASQALDPGLEVGAGDVVERFLGGLGLEAELRRQPAELAVRRRRRGRAPAGPAPRRA